jgi:hypothetical protein
MTAACPHCGQPMTPGGYAIGCSRAATSVRIKLPDYCADPTCRTRRDEAALQRAIDRGLVKP